LTRFFIVIAKKQQKMKKNLNY